MDWPVVIHIHLIHLFSETIRVPARAGTQRTLPFQVYKCIGVLKKKTMNTEFPIKSYPKSELALLYFPGSEAWFYLFYRINAYGNVSMRRNWGRF